MNRAEPPAGLARPALPVEPAPDTLIEDEDVGPLTGRLTFVVDEAGERVDKWLASRLTDRSRSEIQRWIDDGLVLVGGKPVHANYRLSAGEEITGTVPEPVSYDVEPEEIPLDILYEDEDLLVINKPAGLVVHPAVGNWHGTLVNAILFHCPELVGVGGTHRPGIVHRLDKDTSGVIVVAKNDQAQRFLQQQFHDRNVSKNYLALVYGIVSPPRGEIQAPIGRDPAMRRRMGVVSAQRGRAARTQYELVEPFPDTRGRAGSDLSLVVCTPFTGRTHQIRVHMAYIHHPLVGDVLYSGHRRPPIPCPRLFLHAQELSFTLPSTGERVTFRAPLPESLAAVLDALRHPALGA